MPKIEILHHDEIKTNGYASNERQEPASGAQRKLKIIHFNDVYNIESGDIEPKAGAPRFIHAVEELIKSDPVSTLVLFSGDAISPSNRKQQQHKSFTNFNSNMIVFEFRISFFFLQFFLK